MPPTPSSVPAPPTPHPTPPQGGYGAGYLGWQIRTSEDPDMIVKAKELHPKLAVGMGARRHADARIAQHPPHRPRAPRRRLHAPRSTRPRRGASPA